MSNEDFLILSYYIEMNKTFWTYSIILAILISPFLKLFLLITYEQKITYQGIDSWAH